MISLVITSILLSCLNSDRVSRVEINLNNWKKSEIELQNASLIATYNFDKDYCNDSIIFANVSICTDFVNLKSDEVSFFNDTIIVFNIYSKSSINFSEHCYLSCDCILTYQKIEYDKISVPMSFKKSLYNNKRFKYIFADMIVLSD